MPDSPKPPPSLQGHASTRDAVKSLVVAAAVAALVPVFQGIETGQYPLTWEGLKAALAMFGVVFAGSILAALRSGPVPNPEKK